MKMCRTCSNWAHKLEISAVSTLRNFLSVGAVFQFHEGDFGALQIEIHGELARAHVESIGVLTQLNHVVQLDYNLAEPIRGYVALKFACQSVQLGTESEFRQLQ